jgi:type VI secretion system protein ImpF
MPDPSAPKGMIPPVLDRLTARGNVRDLSRVTWSVRDIREAVGRDLEALLNTRWRCSMWPPSLEELERSLVNYGIPDFTGASFSNADDRVELAWIIQRAIERFEPRLKAVSVKLQENDDPANRTMHFSISAKLLMQPSPVEVQFESFLEPATSKFEIQK